MRRFYPPRYYSKRYRDSMIEAYKWDYTRANITRFYSGWGRMKVIGFYSDYIKRVNERRPKRI